jgi:FkbM family methyltransferase
MSYDHAFKGFTKSRSLPRTIRELRHDLFYYTLHKSVGGLEDIGSCDLGCNWTIKSDVLDSRSHICYAGVGRDISFEHELADRLGAKIILLDPSPTALETMSMRSNQRHEFEFLPIALAGHSGILHLSPPPCAEEGSWVSEIGAEKNTEENRNLIQVQCMSLPDLMKEREIRNIDLLKIDIEGAEYPVLDSILKARVPIRQIAVEFDNGILPSISVMNTFSMLIRLYIAGYRLIHKGGSNHTLMHRSYL